MRGRTAGGRGPEDVDADVPHMRRRRQRGAVLIADSPSRRRSIRAPIPLQG
jgi:hypothetical protein